MQRVGVIGLGPIGNRHASIYAGMDKAELVGVCDVDRERADAAKRRLDARLESGLTPSIREDVYKNVTKRLEKIDVFSYAMCLVELALLHCARLLAALALSVGSGSGRSPSASPLNRSSSRSSRKARELAPDMDSIAVRDSSTEVQGGRCSGCSGGSSHRHEVSTQIHCTTYRGAARAVRYAFELTRKRNLRKQLHLVAKTNVLTNVGGTWWGAFNEIGDAEYSDVKREYAHVDAASMWFVKNPEWFDVVVTENLFGDIITDIGAIISGGLGISAGGNINPDGVSMFEPIGGSAPKYQGQGVINPLAAINALHMMLDHLGETTSSGRVESAIVGALNSGKIKSMSAGRMGMGTSAVGDLVAELV